MLKPVGEQSWQCGQPALAPLCGHSWRTTRCRHSRTRSPIGGSTTRTLGWPLSEIFQVFQLDLMQANLLCLSLLPIKEKKAKVVAAVWGRYLNATLAIYQQGWFEESYGKISILRGWCVWCVVNRMIIDHPSFWSIQFCHVSVLLLILFFKSSWY